MKKFFTLTLATILSAGFAFAGSNKPVNSLTPMASPATPSLPNAALLAKENQQLQLALLALENESAELKSQLNYQQAMANLLRIVQTQELEDVSEELHAYLQYANTLANTMMVVQQKANEERMAEQQAGEAYQRLMAVVCSSNL